MAGELPRGCRLCIRGAKLVLFVTGLCKKGCFYCPLSEKRKHRDVVYANERPVKRVKDVVGEAEMVNALGTGITGGDPSMRFGRTLKYIRLLKKKFGKEHHTHLYTCEPLSNEKLTQLKKAGLDEIRFHLWSADPVRRAREVGIVAGVELPVGPGSYGEFVRFFRELDANGCDFANLNEMEFSDTNLEEFKSRGFRAKPANTVAVRGSEKTAVRVLRWAAENVDFDVHYCPSSLKDSVQLRNRLKRKAPNVAKPYDAVTEDGLLFKGVILGLPLKRVANVRRQLIRRHGVDRKLIGIDREKRRIELHWRLAKRLARREPELKFALVEEYPTYDRLETTVIPL